jgi:dipeptidyl aminopeptidase/acylaminoacyl peptidase
MRAVVLLHGPNGNERRWKVESEAFGVAMKKQSARELSVQRWLVLAVLVVGGAMLPGSTYSQTISVSDLVREATIGDPGDVGWDGGGISSAGLVSPNRRKVAIVVRRGDPNTQVNIGEIYVYSIERTDTKGLKLVVRRASATNNQPIALVKWLRDSETLIFAAPSANGKSQVYRFDIRTKELVQLSREPNLIGYQISDDGRRLAAVSSWSQLTFSDDPICVRQGCRIVSTNAFQADHEHDAYETPPLTLYDLKLGKRVQVKTPEHTDRQLEKCPYTPPDTIPSEGQYVLWVCKLRRDAIPQLWNEYAVIPELLGDLGKSNLSFYMAEDQYQFGRPTVVNLRTGVVEPLIEAPFSPNFGKSVWIEHGKRVVLVGAFQMLDIPSPMERARRAQTWAILAIDPSNHQTEVISTLDASFRIQKATWNEQKGVLIVHVRDRNKEDQALAFHRKAGSWEVVHAPTSSVDSEAAELQDGTKVIVDQGLNKPPQLDVLDTRTSRRTVVLEPNAWLHNRVVGRMEKITWKLKDGRSWEGILIYPPSFDSQTRYPLVLQTHGIRPEGFSLSGYTRNYPGQALASAGIVVLQVADNASGVDHHDHGKREWTSIQDAYESAIDYLDQRGLIDRSHVGIMGWSRSGVDVAYTVTHSTYPFAALAFTDTGGLGYWWYLATTPKNQLGEEYDYDGASPFGSGLATWLEMSPGFNFSRARTPTLMWEQYSALGLWDWYSAMRRLGVPVEYWFLPDGAHNLLSVPQRLTTVQRMVDWFRFWLKREIDPDPVKAEQYARWSEMREAFADVNKDPRPPLVHWTATPVTESPPVQ